MNKELEALERLAMPDELHIKECKKLGIGLTDDFNTIEQALQRLEKYEKLLGSGRLTDRNYKNRKIGKRKMLILQMLVISRVNIMTVVLTRRIIKKQKRQTDKL